MVEARVGEAYVELAYDATKLAGSLRAAEAPIIRQTDALAARLGRSFASLGKTITAPISALGRSLTSIQSLAASAGGILAAISLGSGLVETNRTFERLQGSLKTVTGSAEAGQKAFEDLTKFAATTPYDLNQAVEGFISLKARGLDPTIDTMRSFANTASALGKPLSQFIEAVADAASGQNERLKEFGIDAAKMGEKTAFTFQGVTTVIGNSAAEITEYLKAIGDTKFAGATEEQMNKLDGLFSNLSDNFNAFQTAIGTSGFNDGLRALLKTLLDVQAAAAPLAQAIGPLLGGALTRVSGLVRQALDYFNNLSPSMQSLVLRAASLTATLATVVPVVIAFVGGLALLASPIALAIAGVVALGVAYVTFSDKIGEGIGAVRSTLAGFFTDWSTGFSGLGTVIQPVLAVGESIRGAISSTLGILPALARGIGPALQEGLASGLGYAFGSAVALIGTYALTFTTKITEVVASLTAGWTTELGATDWKAALLGLGTQAGEAIDAAATIGADAVRRFAAGVGLALSDAFGVDVVGRAAGLVAALGDRLGVSFDGLTNVVASVADLGTRVRDALFAWVGDIPARVAGIMGSFEVNFAEGIGNLIGTVAAKLLALPIAVMGAVLDAVGKFKNTWTGGFAGFDFGGPVHSLLPKLASALLGFVGKFGEAALDCIASFVQGIGKGFGVDVQAALRGGAEKIEAGLRAAIEGVKTRIKGAFTFTGLFGDAAPAVAAATAPLVAVPLAAEDAGRAVASAAKGIGQDLETAATDGADAMAGMVSDVGAATSGLKVPELAIGNFTGAVTDGFTTMEDQVTGHSTYPDMIAKIGSSTALLQGLMVTPIGTMLDDVAGRFKTTAAAVQADMAKVAKPLAFKPGASGGPAAGPDGPAPKMTMEEYAKGKGWKTYKAGDTAVSDPKAGKDAAERVKRIAEIKAEIEELKRLNAAQGISSEEYARVGAQIQGERAARQLGVAATKEEKDAVSALTIEQDKLTDAGERAKAIRNAQEEVAGLQRIAAAAAVSNEEGERTARVVAAEAAARGLAGEATETQRAAMAEATLAAAMLNTQTDASNRVNDLQAEVDASGRLVAATRQSVTAGEAMQRTLAAEAAVRQQGLTLQDEQGRQLYELTLAQEDNNAAVAAAGQARDLETEIAGLEQVQIATRLSAAAGEDATRVLEAENAVRAAGLSLLSHQGQELYRLTLRQQEATAAVAAAATVRDSEQEAAQAQRLAAAAGLNAAALREVEQAILAENAARELGAGAAQADIDRHVAATLAAQAAGRAQQQNSRVVDLEAELDATHRLANATLQGSVATRQMQTALAAEAAVRAAGLTLQDEQGHRLYELTVRQQDLNAALGQAQQLSGTSEEIASLERLGVAAGASSLALVEAQRVETGLQAVRQAGIAIDSAAGQELYDLTLKREALTAANQRAGQVNALKEEAAGLVRLNVATRTSVAAGEEMMAVLAGEAAVRGAGIALQSAEGQELYRLTMAQDALNASVQAGAAVRDAEQEAGDAARLADAALKGAAATREVERSILAENAARELGAGAKQEDIDRYVASKLAIDAESQARQQNATLNDAAVQADQAARLTAALGISTQAHELERQAIVAEDAARQLGLPIGDARVQQLAAHTLALDADAKAQARITAVRDLEQEVADLERLAQAQAMGAAAYRETEIAIEVETEARRLGIQPMTEEYEWLRKLIEQKLLLNDIPPPPSLEETNAFAGATAALQAYVTAATNYGTLAGQALTTTLGEATTGIADILEASAQGMDEAADTAKRVLDDLLASIKRQLFEFMAQQIVMSFLMMFMGGGPAGPGAPPAGFSPYSTTFAHEFAKGGVPGSRTGISAFRNRVVSKPTMFAKGGVPGIMGEKGKEAIMPLDRDSRGRLGVMVANQDAANSNRDAGPSRVTLEAPRTQIVDMRGSGAPPVEEERTRGPDGQEVVRYLIRDEMRKNVARGDMDRSQQQRFGTRTSLNY